MLSDILGKLETENSEDQQDVVRLLMRAWLNERLSPVLLPPATDEVDAVLELLANQEEILGAGEDLNSHDVENATNHSAETASYVATLAQMELERLKFVISSYYRCRLAKIEENVLHAVAKGITDIESSPEVLNSAEQQFRKSLYLALKSALEETYGNATAICTAEDTDSFGKKTSYLWDRASTRHAVCRVISDIGEIDIDPGRKVVSSLLKGQIYALPYSVIHPLIDLGKVELI